MCLTLNYAYLPRGIHVSSSMESEGLFGLVVFDDGGFQLARLTTTFQIYEMNVSEGWIEAD